MEGKRGLILGVANEKSLAWAIAQRLAAEGARLGFNYVGEALERRVRPLAQSVGAELIEPLNVTEEEQLDRFFAVARERWESLDFVVHSIAYANKEALKGRFVNTARADFLQALDISAYSLVSVARRAEALMPRGGALLTLSYLGAVRAVENYNVMGVAKAALEASVRYLAVDLGPRAIRVNAISAGPVRTLAASGISGFRRFLDVYGEASPLRRNITPEEVGASALYLLSDLSTGVTGEIHYVDAGFNISLGGLRGEE